MTPVLSTLTIECLACSAPLEYAAGSLSTRCPICEDERTLPLRFSAEVPDSLTADPQRADPLVGRTRWRCVGRGCDARFSAAAQPPHCPCCGAAVSEDSEDAPVLQAHGLLPFLVTQNNARLYLRTKAARLGLAGSPTRLERAYLPWVLMTCEVKAEYHGRRGTVSSRGHEHVSWEECSGTVERPFQHLRRCVTTRPDPTLSQRLEPWDWAFTQALAPELLADVPVIHTALTPEQVFPRAFPDITLELHDDSKFDIGGDRQEVKHVSFERHSERFMLVLLPVWIGALDYMQASFVINGRTGEVAFEGHEHAQPDEEDLLLDPGGTRGRELGLQVFGGIILAVMAAAWWWLQ